MANTYIEYGTYRSITFSREDFNRSLRTVASNFENSANVIPSNQNFTTDISNINVPQGTIAYHKGVLYCYSDTLKKSLNLGGSWTRTAFSPKQENGYQALLANVEAVEVGTMVSTVSADPNLARDASLYLRIHGVESAGSLLNLTSGDFPAGSATTIKFKDSAIIDLSLIQNAINTSDIADGAVTGPKFATASIGPTEIEDGKVYTANFKNGAVTTIKIKDDDIVSSKIADNSIRTNHIRDRQITRAKIAPNALTNDKFSTINGNKLANNTVGIQEIKGLTQTNATRSYLLATGGDSFKWSN